MTKRTKKTTKPPRKYTGHPNPYPKWMDDACKAERCFHACPKASVLAEWLFVYDPIGLAAAGCPRDEYMPEAEFLAERLSKHPLPSQPYLFQDTLYATFVLYFGHKVAGRYAKYLKLAKTMVTAFHGVG